MYVFFLFFLVHFFSCCEILNLESSFFLYDHGFGFGFGFLWFHLFATYSVFFVFVARHPPIFAPSYARARAYC